jgi:hypothetical protein
MSEELLKCTADAKMIGDLVMHPRTNMIDGKKKEIL